MKKQALTMVEIIVAMSMMALLSIIATSTLKTFLDKNSDITKFKHLFGTVSEVVYDLKNDAIMYPDSKGFANTDPYKYEGEEKIYGGEEKFRKLFKSKLNILEDNIKIDFATQRVPLYKDGNNYTSKTSINCFMDNKGFMLCPPVTPVVVNNDDFSLFLPVYFNKINKNDSETTSLDKAVFIQIYKSGRIDIPPIVEYSKGNAIIDCTDRDYNSYSHCEAIVKMMETNN